MATLSPIPQPPTVPFLGNVPLLDKDVPLKSFSLLARQYGEIYQFGFPDGRLVVHLNTHALVSQASDDKKFKKKAGRALFEVRNLAGDGLFTAALEEPNWGKAHRILMPAFSTANVIHMFDDMKDICSQMMLKWERFGADNVFDPSEDYTRLTFDTIALCSMSYRFNSFYDPNMPKFTQEMVDVLIESNARAYRPAFAFAIPFIYKKQDEKYFKQISEMTTVAKDIIQKRREKPVEKKDLLNLMLEGRDPKTGEGLPVDNIMYNLLTFLIAGHETTSGMLTFTTYYLLKNPETLRKLREELDRVIGDDEVRFEHLNQLEYLIAVMRESLRLSPTAPSRAVVPLEDLELIGGDGNPQNPANKKYFVKKDQLLTLHNHIMMKDPKVWGEDAEAFRPERMMDGKFEQLPHQAWQPFGYGLRACIGRPFAWQEAQLVLASVFHKFDIFLADPGYSLQIKMALTVKPKDLNIRVAPRALKGSANVIPKPIAASRRGALEPVSGKGVNDALSPSAASAQPLYVFYGSNTGTSESFAQKITSNAIAHGFKPTLANLDSTASQLPTDGPVIIITASFEGEPADNAAQFFAWLQNSQLTEKSLKDVTFAVFGCGNREWVRTYQRVPTVIDELLEKYGGKRILERGAADASSISFFSAFQEYEVKLWDALDKRFGTRKRSSYDEEGAFSVEVVDAGTGRAKLLRQPDAAMGKVILNRLLTKPGVPAKRHIEITLPEGMAYRAGDYLAILPTNPKETVQRALARFGVSIEQEVVIKSEVPTTFPVNTPTSLQQLLSGYVELGQPATKQDIATLQLASKNESAISALVELAKNYEAEVLTKRLSCLDLLELFPEIELSLSTFLRMLPPMRVRQYSISSSPLADPTRVTLTVSILDAPALSGRRGSTMLGTEDMEPMRYLGVASNYLASLQPGDLIPLVVRPSAAAFHLPSDPTVPVVMFCAGSGLAPFRGFVQERAEQKKAGREVGRMLLFVGCRAPQEDYLYAEAELKEWVAMGIVDVRPAFSRKSEESAGCKYVQDRVWHDHKDVAALSDAGARFYTCGSRKTANGIKQACIDTLKALYPHFDDAKALEVFDRIQKERYSTDVFD